MSGDSSSPSSGQPQQGPQQGQQGPQQGSQKPQSRESTPDRPGGQNPGQKPQGQQPQDSKQPDPNGKDPSSPKDLRGAAENRPGGPPPKLDTQRVEPSRDGESWGDLPEQYRELFRTEGGGDLPSQYRDWIDAYYRRLNQRR